MAQKQKHVTEESILLSRVIVEPSKYQIRVEGLNPEHVQKLRLALQSEADIPPVDIFQVNGRLYLVDGFHRFEAHKLEGLKFIKAKRRVGSEAEARQFAQNALLKHEHGLRASKPTLQAILADRRRGEWANWSYARIAAEMGFASHNTAREWIAHLVEIDKLPPSALKVEEVEGKDGKTRNVGNIGGSRKAAPTATPSVTGTGTPEQSRHAEQVEAAKKQLAAKKNTLLNAGIMDIRDDELFFWDEVNPDDPTDTRLRNRRTGEIKGGPQKMPALQILDEKQAEAEGVQRALDAANRREAKENRRVIPPKDEIAFYVSCVKGTDKQTYRYLEFRRGTDAYCPFELAVRAADGSGTDIFFLYLSTSQLKAFAEWASSQLPAEVAGNNVP